MLHYAVFLIWILIMVICAFTGQVKINDQPAPPLLALVIGPIACLIVGVLAAIVAALLLAPIWIWFI